MKYITLSFKACGSYQDVPAFYFHVETKRQRKPKGKSRVDNPI